MFEQFQTDPTSRRTGRFALFASALALFGCVQPAPSGTRPASRVLGESYPIFSATDSATDGAPVASERLRLQEPEDALSLRQALALSLLQNPDLAAFSWESRAREADALQAGVLPNPELSIEAEDFAGNGAFDGYDNAQTTVMLGQLVELGGKRTKRRRVLEAQNRLRLAAELRDLADESLDAVSKRVRAGAASSVEETRASVNSSSAAVAQRRAIAALGAARARLASLWGAHSAGFGSALGELDTVYSPPEFAAIQRLLVNNPDVARWASELAHRKAVVDLQDARRIPNITVGGGVRRFETSNDSALVLGVTVPFPVFDRNQGAREAARSRRSKARSEEQAAVASAARDLEVAYQTLSASYDAVVALRGDVLPQAERAYAGVRTGYLTGLFRYVDVLDAQRTLFELRDQELSELARYHRAAADVERLTGTPLRTTSRGADAEVEN
ncbi:MAG: TolC family protein [Deltaproteobacteria bacterium]|nr:TolC family protein [Deltaproteobacteria bacterium]